MSVNTEEVLENKEDAANDTSELAALQEKAAQAEAGRQKAEEARIRAEAEKDAFQKGIIEAQKLQSSNSGQNGWDEAAWQKYEESTGITKSQAIAHAQNAQALIDNKTRVLEDRLTKAEEKAVKAEERAARLESDRGSDYAKQEYFRGKPVLARYSKEVDEFLSHFPESERRDPAKVKGLMELAETYVKGKVGERMRIAGGSPRMERGEEGFDTKEEDAVDTRGLQENAARFIRSIVPDKDKEKILAAVVSDERSGLAISSAAEWEAGQPKFK